MTEKELGGARGLNIARTALKNEILPHIGRWFHIK
jgi:hypothetical protein